MRDVRGIIRIRPGGYKTPNAFRMCHPLFKPSFPPQLHLMTRRQSWGVLGPPLCKGGNWNSARVAWCHTCTSSRYMTGTWTFWPKSLSSFLFSQFFYTFSASNRSLWRTRDYIGHFYFIWTEFTDCMEISVIMHPASKHVFSVRIMPQGPKVLSSVPRLRERGCLMSSSQKRTQSLKLLPSEGIRNTPRTEWLHFSWQQKCESAKEQAQRME